MDKRPFSILPSSGYKNSQFQIVSSVDDLHIDLILDGKTFKTIVASSNNPTVLLQLGGVGQYLARSVLDGETYEQQIEVVDALRMGSSTLKKTFLFDRGSLSFFLMKDRLHIHNHENISLLTENLLSPSEIIQIDEVNFLFVTRISNGTNGIVNFGLYNTDTYSLQGELLNKYQQLAIITSKNIIWLYNTHCNSIHCFEILSKSGEAFAQIKMFENFTRYELSDDKSKLFLHYEKYITAIGLKDLFQFDLSKEANSAVDDSGNVFQTSNGTIECHNEFENIDLKVEYNGAVNLEKTGYMHVGADFSKNHEEEDFIALSDQIMNEKLPRIPEDSGSVKFQLSDQEIVSQSSISHKLLAIKSAIFLHIRTSTRTLKSVTVIKVQDSWSSIPNIQTSIHYDIMKLNFESQDLQIFSSMSLPTVSRMSNCIYIRAENQTKFYNGHEVLKIDNTCSYYFFEDAENSYILVKEKDLCTLYSRGSFDIPLLRNIKVHNLPYIKEHGMIWYSGGPKNENAGNTYLVGFDLSRCTSFQLDETRAQHSIYKDAGDYTFEEKYILSSNQLVVNPKNGEVMGSIIGSIESISPDQSKVLSRRDTSLYLSVYDLTLSKYNETEIDLEQSIYGESYLSPNGRYLVLQKETNEYLWYDIEKGEVVKFFSGKFLAFNKEGNLVIEEDSSRSARIYDPLTFTDITPPNYHHYRFLSPDESLYAQVSTPLVRYYHKIDGNELTPSEMQSIRQRYDLPIFYQYSTSISAEQYGREKRRIDANRMKYFSSNEKKLREKHINSYDQVEFDTLVKTEKYIKIGIVGTEVTADIILPEDLEYYNYAAFSYDNQYFGYVGKPHSDGLIHLFKLNYNPVHKTLTTAHSYITRYPRYASWVCGFSKTGFFATYDSTPDTYIVKVTDQLFTSNTTDQIIRENLVIDESRIIRSFQTWHEIPGKNYLCFSPSGKFIAVSEQGYEPLTLGGYGHIESNDVHIVETESGKIVDSYTAHGDSIKQDKVNKVTFVAFSEDERRIMTLSNDGVVVVRDIDIH